MLQTEQNNKVKERIKEGLLEAQANKDLGVFDVFISKAVSRKLLVFGTATCLFAWAGLDADIWGMIAMCYIGGQSAIDFAKIWKS
tara:strand:+ start:4431 stop:4685 length:255 start_codon:yes stop_codon:yes gene_type:complete